MRILGLIPARGGSKEIPRKNIKLLCGKPLLQYTAEAALESTLLDRVVLSTDDEEIAGLGRACGLEVPFPRPAELARDDTPTLPVVRHCLEWFEKNGESFEGVCLLQPTNPLRGPEIIDSCIRLFMDSGADTVMTVLPVPAEYNPHWVYFQNEQGLLRLSTGETEPIPRRQELPPAYHREGGIYVTRRQIILEQNRLYGNRIIGKPIPPDSSVNLDSPADWERAEKLITDRAARQA